ncbi:MAG: POTRA domain-containing protein [bacterium]
MHRGDVVDTSLVNAARDSLKNRLNRHAGYPFAHLLRWELVPHGNRSVDLEVLVDSGPLAIVDTLQITGLPPAYAGDIRPLLKTAAGAPFDPALWENDLELVQTNLLERGHPFAKVMTSPLTIRDRGDTVGVIAGMEVVPGRRVSLDHVEIAGLKRTNVRLAARAAHISPGTPFHPERLKAARRRLLTTGWFSDVSDAELLRDSDGRYGILYRVEEGAAGSVSGVVGLAQQGESGLSGALDVSLINILGTGRSAEISWRRDSPQWISFHVAYGEPFLFGGPFSFRFELSQEAAESSWVALDAAADLGLDVGTGWKVIGGITGRDVNADSLAPAADSLSYTLVSLRAAVEFDSRDRPWNPSMGGYYRAGAERGWSIGGNGFAWINRTTVDIEQSLPVYPGWVGFAGLHGVEVRTDDGTPPLAEWERFGGAASLRGYAERSLLAPRAGWLNLEMRRILGGDNRIFALFDVGVLDGAGNSAEWKTSWGLGVQTGAGIGAIQVAVAVPAGEGFSAATVHLIARTTF